MIIHSDFDALDVRSRRAVRPGIREPVALPGVEANRYAGLGAVLQVTAAGRRSGLCATIAAGGAADADVVVTVRVGVGGVDQQHVAFAAIANAEAVGRTPIGIAGVAGPHVGGEVKGLHGQPVVNVRKYADQVLDADAAVGDRQVAAGIRIAAGGIPQGIPGAA